HPPPALDTLSLHDALPIFLPEPIQLALLLVVKHKRGERRVVAEITGHEMKAGAEEAPFAVFVFLQENQIAFRDVKGVGKDRAERSEEHTSELQSLRHLVCR